MLPAMWHADLAELVALLSLGTHQFVHYPTVAAGILGDAEHEHMQCMKTGLNKYAAIAYRTQAHSPRHHGPHGFANAQKLITAQMGTLYASPLNVR